jgi:signal transduction histidine kinase/CheY-like chemotaxis protein
MITGLLLGVLALLVYLPGNVADAWVVMVIHAGSLAGIATILPVYLPVFYAFGFSSAVPTLVALLLPGDTTHFTLAGGTFLFDMYVFMVARINHRSMMESLRLRFENLDLVEALRKQKDEAERANLAKSRFLAAASHDLRQPFHAIGLFTDALTERTQDPEQTRILAKLKTSIRAMQGLFNALLDVSTLDAGMLEKRPTVFPIQSIFDRIALDNALFAQNRDLRFRMVRSSLYVHTDPALLERILRNLASNALRYTKRGGVVIGCRRKGQWVKICIVDSGLGIAPDKQTEIFEEFVQLENPARDRNKGLGLGLAIVRRLAQLLDHRIILSSQPGCGSLFAIEVPRATPATVTEDLLDNKTPMPKSAAGKSIVIVDDDTLVLDALKILLAGWGHKVIAATSGSALRHAITTCSSTPHLIISDYRLPEGESGIQIIEYLRNEFNADIPAVLLTGDTAPDNLLEAQAHGLRLAHKPLESIKLRELIDSP